MPSSPRTVPIGTVLTRRGHPTLMWANRPSWTRWAGRMELMQSTRSRLHDGPIGPRRHASRCGAWRPLSSTSRPSHARGHCGQAGSCRPVLYYAVSCVRYEVSTARPRQSTAVLYQLLRLINKKYVLVPTLVFYWPSPRMKACLIFRHVVSKKDVRHWCQKKGTDNNFLIFS